jgi:hypothetical protein
LEIIHQDTTKGEVDDNNSKKVFFGPFSEFNELEAD